MDFEFADRHLFGVTDIAVIIGKNGCGKSTLLKRADESIVNSDPSGIGLVRYVTPERGGTLTFDASIEQNVVANPAWLSGSRRVNQLTQFKQQTVTQFRTLETRVLREIEQAVKDGTADPSLTFDRIVEKVDSLLDNIQIHRDNTTGLFRLTSRRTGQPLAPHEISSGESELIALAIESLSFAYAAEPTKANILLLDEPDVHLHPDLQARLCRFLIELVDEHPIRIIMATHSTAMLSELSRDARSSVAFMKAGDLELVFRPIEDRLRQVVPIFGAHPLTNIFSESPVLLLEGGDDVRIWQQAIRSSGGLLNFFPVDCDGNGNMRSFERLVSDIIGSLYDSAVAFSLSDRDDFESEPTDLPPIVRMRLGCRTAENLALCDDVLTTLGLEWADCTSRLDQWLADNPGHPRASQVEVFQNGGYDRKNHDLKDIRMLVFAHALDLTKPWEVVVGQVLASIARDRRTAMTGDHGMLAYLGDKTVEQLLP